MQKGISLGRLPSSKFRNCRFFVRWKFRFIDSLGEFTPFPWFGEFRSLRQTEFTGPTGGGFALVNLTWNHDLFTSPIDETKNPIT